MIYALIGYLIFTWFGNPTEGLILSVDLEDKIEIVIKDEKRAELLVKEIDKMSLYKEQYDEKDEAYRELLEEVIEVQTTTKAELENIFLAQLENKRTLQYKLIDARMFFIKELSEDEFNTIISLNNEEENEEYKERIQNLNEKKQEIFTSLSELLNSAISKIEDSDNKASVKMASQNFKNALNALVEEKSTWNLNNKILKNYSSPREKFESLIETNNTLTLNVYHEYISLYITLAQHSTEQEWEDISEILEDIL